MKPARLAVLGAALAAGTGAVLLMGRSSPPPLPAVVEAVIQPAKTIDVLVAAADLPMGQSLKGPDLRWLPWPADSAPAGLIRRSDSPGAVEEIAGSLARTSFLAGEPIRKERLIKTDGTGFMSAVLPAGMRAAAISIDTRGASSAGGFILPNDRVDVLRTYRDDDSSRAGGSDVHVSETILQAIKVLAIGQNVQERNGEKVVTGETATLELTPAQAEQITLAQKTGQISLVLRSLADAATPTTIAPREDRSDSALTVVRYGVPRQTPTKR